MLKTLTTIRSVLIIEYFLRKKSCMYCKIERFKRKKVSQWDGKAFLKKKIVYSVHAAYTIFLSENPKMDNKNVYYNVARLMVIGYC